MKNIFLWIWQMPQHILGFILSRFSKAVKNYTIKNKQIKVYFTSNCFGCGASLGNYIILDYDNYYFECDKNWVYKTICHETGHSYQSKIFGPLYLIIVGITSAIFNNLWDRLFHKKWTLKRRYEWYYKRNFEKWADEVSGVVR